MNQTKKAHELESSMIDEFKKYGGEHSSGSSETKEDIDRMQEQVRQSFDKIFKRIFAIEYVQFLRLLATCTDVFATD